MSKPVLSIFADGVRHDSIKYMPFVNSLNSVPLRSVLGFSITCHPSMYTGVKPDKHKIAFHWVKSRKKNGPYTPLSFFPDFFPYSNPYVQAVFSHFYSKLFLKRKASPFMGYGKILNLPMKFWNKLDINETKYWDDDKYINDKIKTIFELVRKNKVKHHISGMHKPNLGKMDALKIVPPKYYKWIYYFIGDIDHISHEFKQHSEEGIGFLKKLDDFIRERYNEFVDEFGEDGFELIFWSDHGHIPIEKKYNLYDVFNKQNVNLNKIFHIIDSTTARFWTDNKEQESKLISAMEDIPEANLVSEKDYQKQSLRMDRNLYGDLFYYLDGGASFTHTIHGFGLKTKSMHGYHPDAEGNLGLFVSNKNINTQVATLPDVFVSTINSIAIPYEPKIKLDGKDIISR